MHKHITKTNLHLKEEAVLDKSDYFVDEVTLVDQMRHTMWLGTAVNSSIWENYHRI